MEGVGPVVIFVGIVVAIFGWFPSVREMFAESRGGGYAGFLIPIVAFIYAAMHWEDPEAQFWLMVAGAALAGAGLGLGTLGGPSWPTFAGRARGRDPGSAGRGGPAPGGTRAAGRGS